MGDDSNIVHEDSSLLGLVNDDTLRDLLVAKEISFVGWEIMRSLQ
jgi:hypothetical protein